MKINEKNLIAFSVAPTVIQREGHLLKRGEVNRAFHRRWFVLKGNLLFYFEKRGDKEPLGVIILEGCTIELAECEEQVCSFRVIFPGREYLLAADNQELLEAWMKSLARASYSYLKLMVAELEMQLEELNAAERRQVADADRSPLEGRGGLSPPSAAAHHRLNPFNTAEENRNFAQLWHADGGADDDSGDGFRPADAMRRRSNTVSSGGASRPTTVWHHLPPSEDMQPQGNTKANAHYTVTSNNNLSVNSSSNRLQDPRREGSTKYSGSVKKERQTSIFFTSEPPVPDPTSAPVPPKRHKKSSGLKRPPNIAMVRKSDSSASTRSSSSAKSNLSSGSSASSFSSNSSVRQYFPFAQLHMDYGAPILRDRELHRIQAGLCGNHPSDGAAAATLVAQSLEDYNEMLSSHSDAGHKRQRWVVLEPYSNEAILTTNNRENVPPLLPENKLDNSSTNLIDF